MAKPPTADPCDRLGFQDKRSFPPFAGTAGKYQIEIENERFGCSYCFAHLANWYLLKHPNISGYMRMCGFSPKKQQQECLSRIKIGLPSLNSWG